jgi:hypothetical protein
MDKDNQKQTTANESCYGTINNVGAYGELS